MIGRALLLTALVSLGVQDVLAAGSPSLTFNAQDGRVTLISGRLRLSVETQQGLNPSSLVDMKSGRVFADAAYLWPDHKPPILSAAPVIETKDKGVTAQFTGQIGPLTVTQTFTATGDEPNVIREVIAIQNSSATALDTSSFACGFAKRVCDKNTMLGEVADSGFCNVPYRRSEETGELQDYSVQDLITRPSWFSATPFPGATRVISPSWGAEGWAWHDKNNTLLISKYNPDAMEWSLLFPERSGYSNYVLRFGGAALWKQGDPEGGARLAPGEGFTFGVTRYEALDGSWEAGYAATRQFMSRAGYHFPPTYNPPVHWNELYDNPLWEGGDSVAKRAELYRLKDIKFAADEAREIGCQCLYLDPGWDTDFGTTIWAADRLGPEAGFAAMLKHDYGMDLALHTPLAPWSTSSTYPAEARKKNADGSDRDQTLVTESSAYIETKVARLKELCKNGAYFLMFDGSWFPGDGFYLDHGKITAITRQGHLNGVLQIEQQVHAAYPHVIIEQHDPIVGPTGVRYTPTYFFYAKPGAFDDLWGFEFMNDPLTDILSGRARALYYVDLAYNIPIYLHIKLWMDNSNALMLWWYMSTCRHLGMGGKPKDNAVWEAQKAAMKAYLPLKRFYAQGEFYGLDETMHAHTLPDLKRCVIDCFNFEKQPVTRTLTFSPADIGLPGEALSARDASLHQAGGRVDMTVTIPARGHTLVQLGPAGN